jgi:hypothetical protein
MRKILENRVVAVAVGAAIVVGMGAGGAVGAAMVTSADIKDQTIQAVDIHRDAVAAPELADGEVEGKHLSDGLSRRIDTAGEYVGGDWSIVDRNVIGDAEAYLRAGPSSNTFDTGPIQPPLGTGSLGIRTASPDDKAAFGNQVSFDGDLVSDLNTVGYSVFTTGENNNRGNNMPSITFEIDPNLEGSTSNYSSMVYTPANGDPNTWTAFDATDDSQGPVWGLTGAAGQASGCDMNTTRCTWTELQAALDDGGDPATIYTVQITKGRDYAFSGAVDALKINSAVYDFEPLGVQ